MAPPASDRAGAVTISLRRARRDDAAFLFSLVSGEETRPFLGRPAESEETVVSEIERSAREPDEFGWFVVEVDGERAGSVAFHRRSERNRIAEAGRFAIAPAFRGRGIGLEAARRFQRLLLLELGFHRIELQIYAFNERAVAHAERCGYVHEGTKRKAYLRHGEWQDAVLFSLLREDLPD
jgi:RimJ/RimL family protein N-acetyltransferase